MEWMIDKLMTGNMRAVLFEAESFIQAVEDDLNFIMLKRQICERLCMSFRAGRSQSIRTMMSSQ
jgi:hypothetical protein